MLRLHAINLTHTVSKHLSTWMLQIHEHGTVSWEDKHLGIDILTSTFFQVKKKCLWQSPFEKIREIFVLDMPSVFIVCTINRLQDQRSSRQPEFSGCPDVGAFLPILQLSSHEYWKMNDKFERIKTCRGFKQYKQTVWNNATTMTCLRQN